MELLGWNPLRSSNSERRHSLVRDFIFIARNYYFHFHAQSSISILLRHAKKYVRSFKFNEMNAKKYRQYFLLVERAMHLYD